MKSLKNWNEYPELRVIGLHIEEGECRLLEGYIVQRYQENGLWLFSEVADLTRCKVINVEEKLKNNAVESAIQGAITEGMGKLLLGDKWGTVLGKAAALSAASQTVIEITLQHPNEIVIYTFRLIVDRSICGILEPILNGSFKRSATISSINQNLKQEQKDAQKAAQKAALGCLGIIGGIIVLFIIIGLLAGASQSPKLEELTPLKNNQQSLLE